MALQSGISQLAHLGMDGEKLRHGAAILLMLLDAQGQCSDAAQDEEALEGRHDSAGGLLDE